MKQRNLKIWMASVFTMFCMCITPNLNVKANAPQYEIVFKAGLHGTINNEKGVCYPVVAGDIFPNEPVVTPSQGYVFKGWNKELPAVGSAIEGKQTFVAQYDVLVDGVNYIVRYVNENNVEIATPKASMAETGSTIIERAKVIPQYTYKIAQQQFIVDDKNNSFTFVYTSTNPDQIIRNEEEVINQEIPTQGGNQDNNANANTGNENLTNTDTPPITEDPRNNEVVEENETPLVKGKSNDNMNYLFIGGCAAILTAILLLLVWKKKRKTQAIK